MQQYACIFVLRHYLFLKAHSIPQASLSENCSHPGTGNPQTNICAYFCAKWRLLLDLSQQGCFWTLRCFYIYSQGVPRLFQNSDPLSTTRSTKVIDMPATSQSTAIRSRVSLFRRQQINFSMSTDCVCSLEDFILEFSQIRVFSN